MTEQIEPVRKGRGCFFYGCLTSVVVLIIAMLGLYLGTRYAVNKLVERFTDTAPMDLPRVEASVEEAAAVQARFKEFKAALDSGGPAVPLVLGEKDLNVLIATTPEWQGLKDKVYFSLSGNELKGKVSIPLDNVPILKARGRYLNGEATFKAALENGVLIVTTEALEVKGEAVPPQVMQGLRQQNLAQEAYKDVKTAELLRQLESITIKDGRLEIRTRSGK